MANIGLVRVWPATRLHYFRKYLEGLTSPGSARRSFRVRPMTDKERAFALAQYDRETFPYLIQHGLKDLAKQRFPYDYRTLEGLASQENAQTVGFKVRRYRSGEMTGAQFQTGLRSKAVPPSRSGAVVTDKFSMASRQKMRRAAENAIEPLTRFITLTFNPTHLLNAHGYIEIENALSGKSEDYHVGHEYAKKELMRFLNTTAVTYKRRGLQFSYVWVAELQPRTGFIHFHILTNLWIPKDWIKKIWNNGRTRIDYIRNTRHAVNYMRKYMTKDDKSPIKGNRYNISADLRETMKPEEFIDAVNVEDLNEGAENPGHKAMEIVNAISEEIRNRGGIVLDYGFSLPAPRRPEKYKDKKTGEIKQTRGISTLLAPSVFELLARDNAANVPF